MKSSPTVSTGRALRLRDVCHLTGASPASVWRWAKSDEHFPKPFKLSEAITCWDEAEVRNWLLSRKASRDKS